MNKLLFSLIFSLISITAVSSLAMDLSEVRPVFDVANASAIIERCRTDLMSMQEKLSLSDKNSLAIFLQQLKQVATIKEADLMQKGIAKIANLADGFKFSKYAKIDPDFFIIIVSIKNYMQHCLDGIPIQVINTTENSIIEEPQLDTSVKVSEGELCDLLHFLQRKRRTTVFTKADFMKSCRFGSLSKNLEQIDFASLINELKDLSHEERK